MSVVDETIIRLFFEQHGFFVRKLAPPAATQTKRGEAPGVSLHVRNSAAEPVAGKPGFLVFASELRYLPEAEITVKPWPETRFTPDILRSSARLFRFLEKTVLPRARKKRPAVPNTPVQKAGQSPPQILVVPALPTAEPYRGKSETLFREQGVDGLISFRSMLLEVIERLDAKNAAGGSETLETLHLLKKYDLTGSAQLELF